MVKLLGVVGSPRKGGNTETAMREALKAGEQEGAETELIRLADYDLKPCEGCGICRKTGDCVIKDDLEKLYDKVVEADGIIIGSPIYIGLSAITKVFIERVSMLIGSRNRKASRNKVGGAMVVAGRGDSTNARSQILASLMYARMIIASPAVTVLAGSTWEEIDALKDTRGINEARELGRSMVQIAKTTASLRRT